MSSFDLSFNNEDLNQAGTLPAMLSPISQATGSSSVFNEDAPAPDNTVAKKSTRAPRASIAKPISATNMSREDQILVQMKIERKSDKDIADAIREECQVTYVPKTIGTRWARLRKKIAEFNDEQLDKNDYSWTPKEDHKIVKGVHRAKAIVEKLKQDAMDKLWHQAVNEIQKEDRSIIISTRACKERYEAILEGADDLYPEVSTSTARSDYNQIKDLLKQDEETYVEAAKLADEELEAIMENHKDDERSPAPQRRTRDGFKDIADAVVAEYARPPPNGSLAGLDTPINGMPTYMNRSARQDDQMKKAAEDLAKLNLPAVHIMKRKDLALECAARGFQASGTVDELRSIVRKARNGTMNMARSISPPNVAAYTKFLKQKRTWTYESGDEEENEDAAAGDEIADRAKRGFRAVNGDGGKEGSHAAKRSKLE